jgi:DnaJ family protein B protein 12
MEGNKDEALRCLAIAQRHRDSGNIPSAHKFCQKSINLYSTSEALKLLASLNSAASEPSKGSKEPSTSAASSAAESHPSASGAKQRHKPAGGDGTAGGIGGEKREYTAEQKEVVRRVRACKVTEYYEILAVNKECEEADIKKAYRKVRDSDYMIYL